MEKEIEQVAMNLLSIGCSDYTSAIWNKIKDMVIADVKECTKGDDGFTRGDVTLAIGRSICQFMDIEV